MPEGGHRCAQVDTGTNTFMRYSLSSIAPCHTQAGDAKIQSAAGTMASCRWK